VEKGKVEAKDRDMDELGRDDARKRVKQKGEGGEGVERREEKERWVENKGEGEGRIKRSEENNMESWKNPH